MTDRHEVELFLNELKAKINIFGKIILQVRLMRKWEAFQICGYSELRSSRLKFM